MGIPNLNKNLKNLFVVDWQSNSPGEITDLLNNNEFNGYQWTFYNCLAKNVGKGIVSRYRAYLSAVVYILKNKKKYDNIIIWQPMIGFILSLLPRFYSSPKIIITTILYSPARVKKGSFRLFLLNGALKRADALLYFSDGMAADVKKMYPKFSKKIFSTYLPIINNLTENTPEINSFNSLKKENAVFTGGLSDRDFETVIKAFSNTKVPVTIVGTKSQSFKNADLITENFTVVRDVTEIEYYSLILASSFVVIALESEHSSCGQLLFTFCMKNRIPIIATDCYGTRDYISNNENGILVPVKDDRSIFNAYNKLVNDAEFKERLIEHSTATSEKMNFSSYLNKIDSIIKEIN